MVDQLPASITAVVATLAVFLFFTGAIQYGVPDNFYRARLLMTAFFCFIVFTLTVSFFPYAFDTLPYAAPAAIIGMSLGYWLGVKTEQQKRDAQGLEHYLRHFGHIHTRDLKSLTWWSIINFYSVGGGLILVNFVGLSNVIFHGAVGWAIATSAVGAFLLGTIFPYLVYLWTLRARG